MKISYQLTWLCISHSGMVGAQLNKKEKRKRCFLPKAEYVDYLWVSILKRILYKDSIITYGLCPAQLS